MKIKELRMAQGLYQSQLAEAVGVSDAAVCYWESGRQLPSSDKLPALADALHCSIDALFGRDPPGQGEKRGGGAGTCHPG